MGVGAAEGTAGGDVEGRQGSCEPGGVSSGGGEQGNQTL